jgi:hypothetical protein
MNQKYKKDAITVASNHERDQQCKVRMKKQQ